jgi:hypothetical protein
MLHSNDCNVTTICIFLFIQEVDNLLLLKTIEYVYSSIKTLTSLTQLMDKVKNMIIDDNIKDEIEKAVLYVGEVQWV